MTVQRPRPAEKSDEHRADSARQHAEKPDEHRGESTRQDVKTTGQRGLRCPKCGCGHFRVIYTRRAWGGALRRRRECRHCGYRITTSERAQ